MTHPLKNLAKGIVCLLTLWLISLTPTTKGTPLLANETPQDSPHPSCQISDGKVEDMLLYNGTYYIAGNFTLARPANSPPGDPAEEDRFGLLACDQKTGEIISNWDPKVTHSIPENMTVETLALSPNGDILYFGGRFQAVDGETRRKAAAVDRVSGDLLAWHPDPLPSGKVRDIVITKNGKTAYIAGYFGVVAHLATGSGGATISKFAPSILLEDGSNAGLRSLLLSPDDSTLYIGGGAFKTVNGIAREGAAAIDAGTGKITQPFDPNIVDTNPVDQIAQIYEMHWHQDQVYLCGDWWVTEGSGTKEQQRNINRFHPVTGKADMSWLPWTDGGVQACDLDPINGIVFVGGHFDQVGGPGDTPANIGFTKDIAAFDIDTAALLDWRPGTSTTQPKPPYPDVWAVEVDPGAEIAIGGYFESAGGTAQAGFARFEQTPAYFDILLVVEFADNMPASDLAVFHRLKYILGYSPLVLDDDDVTGTEIAGMKLGIITATASSGKVGSKYKSAAEPILTWKPWIYDDMGLTSVEYQTDYGLVSDQSVTILQPGHPLAAGLSGEVDILDSYHNMTWGEPASEGVKIAAVRGHTALFAYETGMILADGDIAAGCRIAFPGHENSPAFHTDAGWQLFDAAVAWGQICHQTGAQKRLYLPAIIR